MAHQVHVFGTLAKVQADGRKHVVTIDVDPDFWGSTPYLMESVGDEAVIDFWLADEEVEG